MKPFFNLKLMFLALVALVLIGMAGFHFMEGWSWFDGFYMVLTTITTIGYGELHPLSPAGRIFNTFIIIAGVALVLLFFGGATKALLEFELQSVFGRRRMDREISRLSDHYILCGAGRVGRSAARELARKPLPFVVIDNDAAKLARYSDEGWLTLVGDATHAPVLRQAHIERARGLVASTTTDATNIYIVLTARSLNPEAEDHCPRQRGRSGEASAHRRCRSRGLALQLRRISHCPNFHAPARGRFLRHRDEPTKATGNRRGAGPAAFARRRPDVGKLAHPAGDGCDRARHQRRRFSYALQSTARRNDPRRRSPDRHGRARRSAAAGTVGHGARMKITTAAEMREIDRVTSERFGVPSLTLMETAGSAIADFILQNHTHANRVTVLCGKGNNGGDGFVVARKLHRAGRVVEVLLLGSRTELKGDALTMFERLPLRPIEVTNQPELDAERSLANCDLLVDAILGTGFRPPVTGLYAEAIAVMNGSGKPVIAVDIPSGADSDSMIPQKADGIARADAIVTFTAPRPAHVFGNLTRGPIMVAPIGSPPEAIVSALNLEVTTPHDFAALLAPRPRDSNKGCTATP